MLGFPMGGLIKTKRLSPCRMPAFFELLAPEIHFENKKSPLMWMTNER